MLDSQSLTVATLVIIGLLGVAVFIYQRFNSVGPDLEEPISVSKQSAPRLTKTGFSRGSQFKPSQAGSYCKAMGLGSPEKAYERWLLGRVDGKAKTCVGKLSVVLQNHPSVKFVKQI